LEKVGLTIQKRAKFMTRFTQKIYKFSLIEQTIRMLVR
jgi:hypothetical protein